MTDVAIREQEQRVGRGQGVQARCTEEKVEADAAVSTTDGGWNQMLHSWQQPQRQGLMLSRQQAYQHL